MKWRIYLIAAAVVAVLQTGVLGAMIGGRINAIQTGREIVLESQAVDPRDLFRGHYVRLSLVAGDLSPSAVEIDREFERNDIVYAEMEKGDGRYWTTKKMWHEIPDGSDAVFLKGTVRSLPVTENGKYVIRFPFDRYFAAKKRALELENMNRDATLGVVLAAGPDGEAYIKGLMLDGETIYDEPLW